MYRIFYNFFNFIIRIQRNTLFISIMLIIKILKLLFKNTINITYNPVRVELDPITTRG